MHLYDVDGEFWIAASDEDDLKRILSELLGDDEVAELMGDASIVPPAQPFTVHFEDNPAPERIPPGAPATRVDGQLVVSATAQAWADHAARCGDTPGHREIASIYT
ncbi:MAG: hypothetical protein AAFV53_35395 [Myxococcota bacterium]